MSSSATNTTRTLTTPLSSISKSKLETCPIFHFNGDKIKVHIGICFIALKVYRELDRMLKDNRMKLSVGFVAVPKSPLARFRPLDYNART